MLPLLAWLPVHVALSLTTGVAVGTGGAGGVGGAARTVGGVGAGAHSGVWPLQPQPEVVRGFDPPSVVWGPGHRGADLLGSAGQPVRSALGGTVSFAGVIAGRGVVVVDHGGSRTTYQPVDASVSRGDQVAGGQQLGTLLWAGTHCAPRACLHWGLIEGVDTYRDPLSLIGCPPGRVRLLPLDVTPATAAAPCSPPLPHVGPAPARPQLRLAGEPGDRPAAAVRR